MAEHWFHVDPLPPSAGVVELPEAEARHAITRRIRPEEPVTLFDGRGRVACGQLRLDLSRRTARAVVEPPRLCEPPRPEIVLACAMPRGERAEFLIDAGTQLGVTQFQPILTQHGSPGQDRVNMPRLLRIAVEACKQSRRAWLPELAEAVELETLAGCAERRGGAGLAMVADRSGMRAEAFAEQIRKAERLTLLVGPEGGFSEAELVLLGSLGVVRLGLASGVLRIETAGLAGVAALLACVRGGGQPAGEGGSAAESG